MSPRRIVFYDDYKPREYDGYENEDRHRRDTFRKDLLALITASSFMTRSIQCIDTTTFEDHHPCCSRDEQEEERVTGTIRM